MQNIGTTIQKFKFRKILSLLLFMGFLVISENVGAQISAENEVKTMKLKISIGENVLHAELYDNATVKDLIVQLPLTVQLEDYANNEKIFYPDPKLSKEGAPDGYKPSAGDITYYAPWGDVAIFYKDFSYSKGLISLGKIESDDIKYLKFSGKKTARLELVEE